MLIDFLNETTNENRSLNKKDPLRELMYPDLDLDELEDMDEDERRDALEEAGYDPDEFEEF